MFVRSAFIFYITYRWKKDKYLGECCVDLNSLIKYASHTQLTDSYYPPFHPYAEYLNNNNKNSKNKNKNLVLSNPPSPFLSLYNNLNPHNADNKGGNPQEEKQEYGCGYIKLQLRNRKKEKKLLKKQKKKEQAEEQQQKLPQIDKEAPEEKEKEKPNNNNNNNNNSNNNSIPNLLVGNNNSNNNSPIVKNKAELSKKEKEKEKEKEEKDQQEQWVCLYFEVSGWQMLYKMLQDAELVQVAIDQLIKLANEKGISHLSIYLSLSIYS